MPNKKQLRNFTEEEVEQFLRRYFMNTDVCHCDTCRLDVSAIMLNNLKQKYIVTDIGSLYAQLDDFDPQHKIDFITILNQAAKIVKNSPRH